MALGGLYHCAKFGWNRHSSFDNMQVLIFCELGLKTPIHALKIGVLPEKGGAGLPSNTMSPGPRSTSIPSGILIHPTFGHNRHGPKSGGAAVPLSVGGRSWVLI